MQQETQITQNQIFTEPPEPVDRTQHQDDQDSQHGQRDIENKISFKDNTK